MKRLYGNTAGLKANQIRRLENLYRRRLPPQYLLTLELTRDISKLSREIRRQIGLLINRQGKVAFVIVGDPQGIVIPSITEYRAAPGRLMGLRCVHTHLKNEPLTQDDLTDLALLRLDMMAAITMHKDGQPRKVHVGHLMPKSSNGDPFQLLSPLNPNQLDIGCLDLIHALEDELSHARSVYDADSEKERALLVSVTTAPRRKAMDSLAELKELAISGGIDVIETILQQRRKTDARFLLGPGKLEELAILALRNAATLIVFDQE
ncbi:GTPase HflX, partial [Thermodesulfobacteriota bacterium]